MSEFPTQVGANSADKMVVEVGTANKPAAAERSALSVIEQVLGTAERAPQGSPRVFSRTENDMSSVRFLTAPNAVVRHFSSRSYKANGLGIVDVLTSDAPGIHGQGTRLFETGTTAQRPVAVAGATARSLGYAYYDQSLAGMIFWTGSGWIDAAGNAV